MRLRDQRIVDLENISALIGLLSLNAVATAVVLVNDLVDGLVNFQPLLSAHVLG